MVVRESGKPAEGGAAKSGGRPSPSGPRGLFMSRSKELLPAVVPFSRRHAGTDRELSRASIIAITWPIPRDGRGSTQVIP